MSLIFKKLEMKDFLARIKKYEPHTLSPEYVKSAHFIYSKGLAPGKSGIISARSLES
jgi:hypothetical protein